MKYLLVQLSNMYVCMYVCSSIHMYVYLHSIYFYNCDLKSSDPCFHLYEMFLRKKVGMEIQRWDFIVYNNDVE